MLESRTPRFLVLFKGTPKASERVPSSYCSVTDADSVVTRLAGLEKPQAILWCSFERFRLAAFDRGRSE